MYPYKAPLRDIKFSAFDVMGYSEHYAKLPGTSDLNLELAEAILEASAKFAETTLAPLNASADQQGCQWKEGAVRTPEGFAAAFTEYAAGGWVGLSCDTEIGGQGLPRSLDSLAGEARGAANLSWSLCTVLGAGAINTLNAFGTAEQKETYLKPLVAGDWTATMCLTEAHCGTDLGLLRTRAEPQADGSYALSGSKIFITFGEHDMTDNIVHIVLARLPGAPQGSKGISLFIVPKFLPNADGTLGPRNRVVCGSIEEKMGIHGSPTCVMNFDQATGYLLGDENRGLNAMFTFMNTMRLGTAQQGVIHADVALQQAAQYASERLQMRSLTGIKQPDAEADAIIVHPDVRRMLLTQKAIAEGGRMFVHFMAQQADISSRSEDAQLKKQAEDTLSFTTPIGKAFLTELGLEAANLGIQCFGGHGFIREAGVEQNFRDARISTLYEGTTGIQALDLLGRKVLGSGGQLFSTFSEQVQAYCERERAESHQTMTEKLSGLNEQWQALTSQLADKAMKNADEVGAASVDYLMYSGYVMLGYFWLRAADVALVKQAELGDRDGFYQAKIDTAQFYFQRLLPRTLAHREAALAGAESLMDMPASSFLSR